MAQRKYGSGSLEQASQNLFDAGVHPAQSTIERGTQAQRIAARFSNDGLCWQDVTETRLLDVLRESGARRDVQDDSPDIIAWRFLDGSSIVTTAGAWDLGFVGATCHCWAGAGHREGCSHV